MSAHKNQPVVLSQSQKFSIHFASGGFALATAFACMHPLDTLKCQLQTNTLNLRGLGKGFFVSFLLAAPQGGLRLGTYELCKAKLLTAFPDLGVSASSAVAACAGDTMSSIVKVPREVITARLQSGMDATFLSSQRASPALATLRLIVQEQGVRGLFRGFWSTTARDWPFMVILFTTYESFKQNHHVFKPPSFVSSAAFMPSPLDQEEESITTLKSTIFGGISGALAGFLTTPFDVIKTRIMTQKTHGSSSIPRIASQIWDQGRMRAFFVGGGTRSVWWFGVCSIFFPLYETGKDTMQAFYRKEQLFSWPQRQGNL
ncbi:hypothetical protein HDU91_001889 [Kappamyces sp. JEL0680]|nr:hypothetical protein HDU91_001889 [Kappamyces sp. JEL0680]